MCPELIGGRETDVTVLSALHCRILSWRSPNHRNLSTLGVLSPLGVGVELELLPDVGLELELGVRVLLFPAGTQGRELLVTEVTELILRMITRVKKKLKGEKVVVIR
jgi:hypothetical protein